MSDCTWMLLLISIFSLLIDHWTRATELINLVHGTKSSGIVQLYYNSSWQFVCLGQATNLEAEIICQELGLDTGLILPAASYGKVDDYFSKFYVSCNGKGQFIKNCSLVETDNCNQDYFGVSCFEYDTLFNHSYITIQSNLSYGQLNWFDKDFQTTGQICSQYWGQEETEVACKQLGYDAGLPTVYKKLENLPFLVSINCTGQEQSLNDCVQSRNICDLETRAGVICIENSGLNISINNGGKDYGRVDIEVNGELGTICNIGWSNRDAEVICKYLGYLTGRKWSGPFPPGQGHLYMTDVDCTGEELLITECPSSGWRNVTDEDCLNHSKDAGVSCYGSVRLSGGQTTEKIKMGRVEVYQGTQWTNLCTSHFDDIDALVVCRQLGYARAKVLSPGLFGRSPYSDFTTEISCYGNETDILDCPHKTENCAYSEYASVICIKENVNDDFQTFIDKEYTGEVRVIQYGIRGTVCQDGWDNNDARVLCHQNGYLSGQVYGTLKLLSQIDPIWLTMVDCSGNESSISECSVSVNMRTHCSSNVQPAGVICYNETGMELRLVGGDSPNEGTVEVGRDGVWGTICDNKWSHYDAKVVCEQLGFGGGSEYTGSHHGTGTGTIVMDYLQCDGTETSIFACPNLGWGVATSSCMDHSKDAGVECKPWMKISTESAAGYLLVWKSTINDYGLVCADDFDDTEASVVCKHLKSTAYGISHCCSAYGHLDKEFAISQVDCNGQENSLKQCKYNTDSCLSGTYASVICTNYMPSPGSEINYQIIGDTQGFISIEYALVSGLICAEGFNNKDATVICRQKNHKTGIAYRHNTNTSSYTHAPRWLSHINCSGQESFLHQCDNLKWGKIGNCSMEMAAGVICSTDNSAPADINVRLVDGLSSMDGRVEIQVQGNWFSVCTNSVTESEAKVVCRMAGFPQNTVAKIEDYDNGQLSPLISYARCSGLEKSLFDCVLELSTSNSACKALGVKCQIPVPHTEATTVTLDDEKMPDTTIAVTDGTTAPTKLDDETTSHTMHDVNRTSDIPHTVNTESLNVSPTSGDKNVTFIVPYTGEYDNSWVWIVLGVLGFTILLLLFLVIKCEVMNLRRKYKAGPQSSFSHQDSVIEHTRDGSIHAENPLSRYRIPIHRHPIGTITNPVYDSGINAHSSVMLPPISEDEDQNIVQSSNIQNETLESQNDISDSIDDSRTVNLDQISISETRKCDICQKVTKSNYLTVVFQTSVKENVTNKHENLDDTVNISHLCPGCNFDGENLQDNSEIQNKNSPNSNLEIVPDVDVCDNASSLEQSSKRQKEYLTVVFEDNASSPEQCYTNKNDKSDNINLRHDDLPQSAMRDSIQSLSLHEEVDYPKYEEVTEL